METLSFLAQYYQNYDEHARLASRHGSVEFLTTMRYVERYAKPGCNILEIGAATGRYSHALARMGFEVDAVELIEHNVEIFRENTQPGEKITVTQGNAVDLSAFSGDSYDITLLLGPMYHLFADEDKRLALSEALRVTKPGGVVFAAYCISDPSILDFGFNRGMIHSLIERKMLDLDGFKAHSDPSDLFVLHRKEDIDELMGGLPADRLHYVAADGYTNHMRDAVDGMDDATFDIYLKYHFFTCERPDMAGLTHHALDIFRKRDEREVEQEIEYYRNLPCEFEGFIDLPELYDGTVRLICAAKQPPNPQKNWLPSYDFLITVGSERVGDVGLRIGYGGGEFNANLYYGGQIGYNVDEKHRGNGYAGRAVALLVTVAKAHKMEKLLITNAHTNAPSRRVCEKLGARHIRLARLPEWHDLYKSGDRFVNIYEMDV